MTALAWRQMRMDLPDLLLRRLPAAPAGGEIAKIHGGRGCGWGRMGRVVLFCLFGFRGPLW